MEVALPACLMLALLTVLVLADTPTSAPAWTTRADALWEKRDDPAAMKDLSALLKDEMTADPKSVEALVRKAMQQCWMADGMQDGSQLKASLGKNCWETADKAIALNPNEVRAQYWATVGIGLYSEGVGILTALGEGLEGKFKERGQAAMRIDPEYLMGSPAMLMGRFFYKLPWPKRDLDKSLQLIESTVKAHPENLLAHVYYAATLDAVDRKAEAKQHLDLVLAAKAANPQDKRSQAKAQKLLDKR